MAHGRFLRSTDDHSEIRRLRVSARDEAWWNSDTPSRLRNLRTSRILLGSPSLGFPDPLAQTLHIFCANNFIGSEVQCAVCKRSV